MSTLRALLDAVEEADKVHAHAAQEERQAKQVLEQAKEELQNALIEQGTDIARKDGFTATLVEKERPNVVDWDAFYGYLKRTGDLHLLERRVSSKAYAETLESRGDKPVPGVNTFRYQRIQVRRG